MPRTSPSYRTVLREWLTSRARGAKWGGRKESGVWSPEEDKCRTDCCTADFCTFAPHPRPSPQNEFGARGEEYSWRIDRLDELFLMLRGASCEGENALQGS